MYEQQVFSEIPDLCEADSDALSCKQVSCAKSEERGEMLGVSLSKVCT